MSVLSDSDQTCFCFAGDLSLHLSFRSFLAETWKCFLCGHYSSYLGDHAVSVGSMSNFREKVLVLLWKWTIHNTLSWFTHDIFGFCSGNISYCQLWTMIQCHQVGTYQCFGGSMFVWSVAIHPQGNTGDNAEDLEFDMLFKMNALILFHDFYYWSDWLDSLTYCIYAESLLGLKIMLYQHGRLSSHNMRELPRNMELDYRTEKKNNFQLVMQFLRLEWTQYMCHRLLTLVEHNQIPHGFLYMHTHIFINSSCIYDGLITITICTFF